MAQETQGSELRITRVFNAPRELVFKAWTEADRLAEWWGPKGLGLRVLSLDLRPGGIFHYAMIPPQGEENYGRFVYREIDPPQRLVFVSSFSDQSAGLTRPPFDGDWPAEILTDATFTEADGKTTVTLRGTPVNPTGDEAAFFTNMHGAMHQGYGGSFEKLDDYLDRAQA